MPEVLIEHPGYLPIAGSHLYTVLHQAEKPIARMLLCGPFASERHFSIGPWVSWARYLSARNIEVLRYDYRGVGESEGIFEETSFAQWGEDVVCLAKWLRDRSPELPLILNGLELGALLAGKAFTAGMGDVLLLWSAPANANLALRPALIRWAIADQLYKFGADRKTASAFIRELEQGSTIEVEGFRWSPELWRESLACPLPQTLANAQQASAVFRKPVRSVKLGKEAIPMVKGGPAVADVPWDLTALFAENYAWLFDALAGVTRGDA